ncbi:MAG: SagB/ThcOx family dehydrogenase [Candidatus Babeliales bacterium]
MNFVNYLITAVIFTFAVVAFVIYIKSDYRKDEKFSLPVPNFDGKISVEKAIKSRRSIRSYKQDPLTLEQVGQILWAAQGITSDDGFRSAPSAGATYPLEIYLVVGKVTGLTSGIYKYLNKDHVIIKINDGDKRAELSDAALSQEWIKEAPIEIIICGIYERTSKKYAANATKFVHMEVGCVAQNVYLQATALGLGTTFVGAGEEEKIASVLHLDKNEHALCILPVGVIN